MQFGISYTQVCFSELTSQAKEDVQLVSWYSEPSQPQQITSGLKKKNNFNLSPRYFAHKSSNHKLKQTTTQNQSENAWSCQRPHLRVWADTAMTWSTMTTTHEGHPSQRSPPLRTQLTYQSAEGERPEVFVPELQHSIQCWGFPQQLVQLTQYVRGCRLQKQKRQLYFQQCLRWHHAKEQKLNSLFTVILANNRRPCVPNI